MIVCNGDGSLLMNLGTLVTITAAAIVWLSLLVRKALLLVAVAFAFAFTLKGFATKPEPN